MRFIDKMRDKGDRTAKTDIFTGIAGHMELPPPLLGTSVCSDDQCPCDEWAPGTQMPPAQGYMYIAPEVVEFRKDCLSIESFEKKMKRLGAGRGDVIIGGKNLIHPVVLCEQGARLRDLDLQVAAQDFDSWMSNGRIPCRPTPCATHSFGGAVRPTGTLPDDSVHSTDLATYTDRESGFSFAYPRGWVRDLSGGALIIRPEDADHFLVDGRIVFAPAIEMIVGDCAVEEPSRFYRDLLGAQRGKFDDYELLWEHSRQLGSGEEALEWSFRFTRRPMVFTAVAVVAAKHNGVFMLTGSCLTTPATDLEPLLRQVAASLSLEV